MTAHLTIVLGFLLAVSAAAEEMPATSQRATYRIVGLFDASREADLRAAVEKVPGVTLTSIDLEHGEGVFSYDPSVAFKGTKPEQIIGKFDELLRNASHHTLSIQPLLTTPHDKLTSIEIKVIPLDCRACALALHEILMKIDGVAQVSVSRADGRITALVDPDKTNRAALEEVLTKREIRLAAP